ncbi:MAG: hypothetical protein DCO96_02645 [Fluviicola sp. XM-24bin1]|nr:MAG: hypothetical protein DCO96_02645 [Fluviicola sp. XM-24bin1]
MDILLNVNQNHQKIHLSPGGYYILIVGGYYIEEHSFSVSLIDVRSNEKISVKRAKRLWTTSIGFGKRAKYFYYIDVENAGEYAVNFSNPQSLVVYRYLLWIYRMLSSPVDNSLIEIAIRKNG